MAMTKTKSHQIGIGLNQSESDIYDRLWNESLTQSRLKGYRVTVAQITKQYLLKGIQDRLEETALEKVSRLALELLTDYAMHLAGCPKNYGRMCKCGLEDRLYTLKNSLPSDADITPI